jgi:5-methylcytosine-specific restriction endonuclease McrA
MTTTRRPSSYRRALLAGFGNRYPTARGVFLDNRRFLLYPWCAMTVRLTKNQNSAANPAGPPSLAVIAPQGAAGSVRVATKTSPARLAYIRAYRKAHPEVRIAERQRRRAAHALEVRRYRERHKVELKAHYDANREAYRAKGRRSYHKTIETRKAYRATHRDILREKGRTYCSTHREEYRARSHGRRATAYGGNGAYSVEEWKALCAKWGNKCLCCGAERTLTVDHVVPVSKGGANSIDNLQLLCRFCNSTKNTRTIDYRPSAARLSQTRLPL